MIEYTKNHWVNPNTITTIWKVESEWFFELTSKCNKDDYFQVSPRYVDKFLEKTGISEL